MNNVHGTHMSVEEAAMELGRSQQTILKWIHSGRFYNVIEYSGGWPGRPAYYISRDQVREVKEQIESGEKRYVKPVRIVIEHAEKPVKTDYTADIEAAKAAMREIENQITSARALIVKMEQLYLNLYCIVQDYAE